MDSPNYSKSRIVLAVGLILLGAIGRAALSGLPNIETILVASFAAAALLSPGIAMLVSLIAMVISDLLIGNSIFSGEKMNQIVMFTYSGFAVVSLISILGKSKARAALSKISAKSIFASAGIGIGLTIVYDVWTNIGWWYLLYPHTIRNLAAVFAAGVPFMARHAVSSAIIFAAIGLPIVSFFLRRSPNAAKLPDFKICFARSAVPAMAVACALVVLSFSGCISSEDSLSGAEPETAEAGMIIRGNGWTIECMNVSIENDTIYSLLCRCASERGFVVNATYSEAYGSIYVEEINGTSNGQDGKYWMYYINGELVWESSDRQAVSNGDVVEWRFESF